MPRNPVLHGERRQPRRIRIAVFVQRDQLGEHHADRPAVGDDAMHAEAKR